MPHSNIRPTQNSKSTSNSRARRSARDREKRKSQGSEKNEHNTTEKSSPVKDTYKCTGISKDLIQSWADPTQFEHFSDDLCSGVAEDLSYRVRYVIHDALTKARLCGRNSILAADIEDSLQVLQIDKIYGPARSMQFAKDEMIVNLFTIADAPLTYNQPGDVTLQRHWLPSQPPTTPHHHHHNDTGLSTVHITPPPSVTLVNYFRVICRTLVAGDAHQKHVALGDVRSNMRIGPIAEWFYNFSYKVLSKDVTCMDLTWVVLRLLGALEGSVVAAQTVSSKVVVLLVRLLFQRLMHTPAEADLYRRMCATLALLCERRPAMRDLVAAKLTQRACADSKVDYSVLIVTVGGALGAEVVERAVLPHLRALLCNVASRVDPALTTALKLMYYNNICKIHNDPQRLELDNLFLDTFNYALLPMWVQRPLKLDYHANETNASWTYAQLYKTRRSLSYKWPKSKKSTLQQAFTDYHICCNCKKVKTTNFFTPKTAVQFKFAKTATKCVRCAPIIKREISERQKLVVGKSKLLISVFKDVKNRKKSLNTCYINTFRFHVL